MEGGIFYGLSKGGKATEEWKKIAEGGGKEIVKGRKK
jgi:hypothetical protein